MQNLIIEKNMKKLEKIRNTFLLALALTLVVQLKSSFLPETKAKETNTPESSFSEEPEALILNESYQKRQLVFKQTENNNYFPIHNTLQQINLDMENDDLETTTQDEPVEKTMNIQETEPLPLTNEEKKAVILEREKLTESQFHDIVCTLCGEGGGHNYDECYYTTSTLMNHKRSKSITSEVSKKYGENMGNNLYTLIIFPGHFAAYYDANYDRYNALSEEELTSLPGYQAIIDCLYSNEPAHNYLCFCSPQTKNLSGKQQFYEGGNYYYLELPECDTIPEEERTSYAYGEEAQQLYNTETQSLTLTK